MTANTKLLRPSLQTSKMRLPPRLQRAEKTLSSGYNRWKPIVKSQISEMEADLAEYDFLKSGQVSFAETSSLSELPKVLVQARIAKGMSQTDLAEKLGMKPQQIQRYEATDYMSASLARLIEVAAVLEVKISKSLREKPAPLLAPFLRGAALMK